MTVAQQSRRGISVRSVIRMLATMAAIKRWVPTSNFTTARQGCYHGVVYFTSLPQNGEQCVVCGSEHRQESRLW